MDTVVVILALAVVCGLCVRSIRKLGEVGEQQSKLGALGEKQRAILAEVVQELALLRSGLVDNGVAQRSARLPLPPAAPRAPELSAASPPGSSARVLPPIARPVTVTGDDHPDHTRATVVAPQPTGRVASKDGEPPSTKPSTSRRRPLPLGDQLRRIQDELAVPPDVEERVVARILALRAERKTGESDELADEEVWAAVRAVYETLADAQDARDAQRIPPTRPPPSEAAPTASGAHGSTAPAASGPVLPALVAAGLGERPKPVRSERPPHAPPHPIERRQTLLGLSDAALPPAAPPPPTMPASRRLPPATPPPPRPPATLGSARPDGQAVRSGTAPRPATSPVAMYATPRPPAPPPRVQPAAVKSSTASPGDFPDDATRAGRLPTAADLAPVKPSAAADFDDPDEATRCMARSELAPKADAPSAKPHKATLRSMESVVPPGPRSPPEVTIVVARASGG